MATKRHKTHEQEAGIHVLYLDGYLKSLFCFSCFLVADLIDEQ
jgi:hypothetical protein